jgi:4-amino-4-deoxy-L-arabinose transferase-like glycosyltransferase
MSPSIQAGEPTGYAADPAPAAAPAGRRRRITACVLALAIASVLAVRLSNPELHIDEITYMSRVLESMAQDSVFPVQGNGELFMNKPPLAFWLMRLSFQVLGPSPFAARLPSVLAAAATAVLLYIFGSARFGERAGILAALVFALTPGLMALHGIRSATTDALEVLLVTSAIVALESWRRRRQPWRLACMVVLVGATAWVKSPFAVMVFLAILLATEWPARRAGQGTPRFGFTVAWVIGVWLGFYILWLGTLSFATSTRVVTNRLLVQQYANRIEGRISAYHVQGPGYYAVTLAHDFGPLLLLPVCLVALKILASRRGWKFPWYEARYEVTLLVVWALAAPVLGTASISKRPWYAYLSYPGIALLLAVSGDGLARTVSSRRSVRSALLATVALVHAGRISADKVWPAEGQYRSLAGRLWEVADRDSRIRVVAGPRFQLPRQHDIDHREARLFVRLLSWRSSRDRPAPGSCQATLVSSPQDVPEGVDALELQPATRRDTALFLLDDCGGKVREQVSRP